MPLTSVKFAPGVNEEVTPTQGVAQIIGSQLIRFRFAGQETLPEKLGGWQKFFPLSMGSPPRDLHAWEGINNDTHLAIGCTQSLNVITDGVLQDITPRSETTNVPVSFTTTNGSSIVTIDDPDFTPSSLGSIFLRTQVSVGGIVLYGAYEVINVLDADSYQIDAGVDATASVATGGAVPEFDTTASSALVTVTLEDHGYVVGQVFPVGVSTTVGGITISGAYLVREVLTADTFTFITPVAASTTDNEFMNAGEVQITYYVGIAPSAAGAGYGTSGYGDGGYGIGIIPTPSLGTAITATNWSLDNWGEVLIACPKNGPIYQWSPDSGFSTAIKIAGAPDINGGAFVSQSAQVLVAWGSSSTQGVADPLNVNWSTVGDYSNWTVTSQTQAGGFRIPTGSRIMGGMAAPNFNLIWTDLDLWSMDYVGPPEVYGFNTLGFNCGLISQHAAVSLNTMVYWMGNNQQFFMLVGEAVQVITCTVWDFVFQDLDEANVDKIYAGSNSLFNEVTWYYPSASGGTGEVDSYVKFNVALNTWDCGRLDRSAWIDQSPVGKPIGASPTGYLYQHETSPDADGQPMISWFETGYFAIAEGENLTFVDWIFPDFRYGYVSGDQDAILQMSLTFTDYPNGVVKTKGPYSVSNADNYINMRLRGRLVAVRIESQDLGSFWRLGGIKFRSVGDGKR